MSSASLVAVLQPAACQLAVQAASLLEDLDLEVLDEAVRPDSDPSGVSAHQAVP